GRSVVRNPLYADDTGRTLSLFRELGVTITEDGKNLIIEGKNGELDAPSRELDCGNSGTTMRLMTGILAGKNFESVMTGDASLSRRPMKRVMDPLRKMGADLSAKDGNYPPLRIRGKTLRGISEKLALPSAQVKSAVILAALDAEGETLLSFDMPSRDHTERMLPLFGGKIELSGNFIRIPGQQRLRSADIEVPADFSSASFFLVLGLLFQGADLLIEKVGLNPTRTGFLNVLERMGAGLKIENRSSSPEPSGDIAVRSSGNLRAVRIEAGEVPLLIDEIPLLALIATRAAGETRIEGASELRVKESDRLHAITLELNKMGADITEYPDGLAVRGPRSLHGAEVDSHRDHRIAMTLSVAGLIASGETSIRDCDSVIISYPDFYRDLEGLYA
ncbi:MAG TPA: 3-phosphoshikimate 1-carboxyvinyltransferase, partial [bacterium]|nr:3-phosphoshikimate 1-carboxyvinyltransferase [bacterium]